MYKDRIEKILENVEKPVRYLGNEWNSVHKDLDKIEVRFVFAFPDVYEIGMSHLGIKILYHLLNEKDDIFAERVFAPWVDMERELRESGIPLFSLETREPLKNFDFIGFTLQYELSYTNVLNMLDLAQIPLLSAERDENHPFIIGGGPCAFNPEPLADFFDFFVIGEGEQVILEILDLYKTWKKGKGDRRQFLRQAAGIRGIYVPHLYEVLYNEDGTVRQVKPVSSDIPWKIEKRIIGDLDKVYYPKKLIVPFMNIIHDRAMLEIFRGCTRGCRFCQAGMIYRPVRERSVEVLKRLGNELVDNTGYEEVSLASLSTSDYPYLEELTQALLDDFRKRGVSLSLPSLRIDSFSLKLAQQVQEVRKSGLTFAPEAGTQRLRDVINKGVTERDLLESAADAFKLGWHNIKLYFMIGLPTETYDDLDGIIEIAFKLIDLYKDISRADRRKLRLTVSVSSFVPKPFTPFQWEPQFTIDELKKRQEYLKKGLKHRAVSFSWHESELSFLEAVFARGDRRLSKVVYKAWLKGCKFDSWSEHFKFFHWMEAFKDCGIRPEFYAYRIRGYDEVFPWDHIYPGISKEFLIREHKKALKGNLTPDCRIGHCTGCGVNKLQGGKYCAD